ncbi:hypothetical protein [Desulforamulus ruminis]|uniref:Uncharacterized protein n=1 Tax=Desulforamulus ruminis (strain ATCC 23193 / DSM 2154 / NCIMB 8452 / DL) TaxID=696281 RepID=F6DTE5_DESRL|nr:hypothetical protein [Desulforamulus ruminis]AEG60007.1 hypothetical protein Desru_1743 [Desulforamulus ruminis DSM 2154]
MATNTQNLNLLKIDPVADGNEYFDVERHLNENWDKIDQDKAAQDAALTAHLADSSHRHKASNISVADTGNHFTATDVEGALAELFTSVSDGKNQVATAITDKGVPASGSDTFPQLATKIGQINTGVTPAGTAVVGDVLTGKTFINSTGSTLTGTMPNRGAANITPGPAAQTIAQGYHNGSGRVAAVTFDASKVLIGTTIAGTAGTMPNRGAPTFIPGIVDQNIPAGYVSGGIVKGDADLISANIKTGVDIFGIAGSLIPSGIRSIQKGTSTISSNSASVSVTIGSVDVSKTIVLLTFVQDVRDTTYGFSPTRKPIPKLESPTTLTLSTRDKYLGKGNIIIGWTVVEFSNLAVAYYSGSGYIDASSQSKLITISPINVDRTFIVPYTYASVSNNANDIYEYIGSRDFVVTLYDASNIQFYRPWGSSWGVGIEYGVYVITI